MSPEVVQVTSVGVAVVVSEGAPAISGVHHSGGDHKPSEFVSAQVAHSSANSGASAHKLGPTVSAHPGGEKHEGIGGAESPSMSLVPMEPVATSIPALVPLGTGGRPKVLTPELTEKLYMLLSVGFSRRQAAAYLGLSPSAIPTAASRNPEFAAELKRAEELTALQSEMTIMAAARKNWKAAAWYLTFKAKNPPPLSEEEKEERHQARLAEERRNAEQTRTWMEAMTSSDLSSRGFPPSETSVRKPRRGK